MAGKLFRILFVLIISACFLCAPCSITQAFADIPANGDTVDLPFELFKFEGSELLVKRLQKFAELDLGGNIKSRGQTVELAYRLQPGNAPLEVIENYKQSFSAQNFKPLKEFPHIYTAEASDDGYTVIMKRDEASGSSFIKVQSYTVKQQWRPGAEREYYKTTVKLNPDQVLVLVDIVTPKAIGQKMVKEEVAYILRQLTSEGRVSLYGIYFDTDKTDLKPESEPVLAEVQKALTQNPSLRLTVIGHTDSTGGQEHNQTLSQGRAEAVVLALTSRGVAQGRLTAQGKGDSQPVASNDSEEGRSKNRRVELVKVG